MKSIHPLLPIFAIAAAVAAQAVAAELKPGKYRLTVETNGVTIPPVEKCFDEKYVEQMNKSPKGAVANEPTMKGCTVTGENKEDSSDFVMTCPNGMKMHVLYNSLPDGYTLKTTGTSRGHPINMSSTAKRIGDCTK